MLTNVRNISVTQKDEHESLSVVKDKYQPVLMCRQ